MELWPHQINAIRESTSSGIHCHATGTGKTRTALNIVKQYIETHPQKSVIWFCERKNIIMDTFKERQNYFSSSHKIMIRPKIADINLYQKPIILVVNRSYIAYKKKYLNINRKFGLLIHDECHSAVAPQTYAFLQVLKSQDTQMIGFSATPIRDGEDQKQKLLSIFGKILTNFHLKDAIKQGIIVPPKFYNIFSENLKFSKYNSHQVIQILEHLLKKLPYKKIIAWCRTVKLATYWAEQFQQLKLKHSWLNRYLICLDTSKSDKKFLGYQEFKQINSHGFLFCAAKHREGSDIKHLDGCIFFDGAGNRQEVSFIQSIGRVVRKAPRKEFGMVIDLFCTDPEVLADKIWYYFEKLDCLQNSNKEKTKVVSQVQVSNLMIEDIPVQISELSFKISNYQISASSFFEDKNYTIQDLTSRFVRQPDKSPVYQERLKQELETIDKLSFVPFLMQVMDILSMIKDIKHIIRGSSGSSYVCYLLGITLIDPVKYGLNFVRFISSQRDSMPDIDMDFPWNKRNEIFRRIDNKWPGCVGRISNHIHYHEKSALREAIRKTGYRKRIGKDELKTYLSELPCATREWVQDKASKLEDTFRCFSLHCGGIVIFKEGIPPEIRLNTRTKNQINWNKDTVKDKKHFKIDILSNRGLAILFEIDPDKQVHQYLEDPKVFNYLSKGRNIGITFAETPTMRKAFNLVKPKSIIDIAFCLALIRPAAADEKEKIKANIDKDTLLIYDDDAIKFLQHKLNCDAETADILRRAICKQKSIGEILRNKLGSQEIPTHILDQIATFRKYSFCKSHAISYAQLVYALAYQKYYQPKKFWKAVLNHANTSYRKWVHFAEAKFNKLEFVNLGKKPFRLAGSRLYASNPVKNTFNNAEQWSNFKYNLDYSFWPNCYFRVNPENKETNFRGLIATGRTLYRGNSVVTFLTIGVGYGNYVDLIIKGKSALTWARRVTCQGFGLFEDSGSVVPTCQVKIISF